MNIEELGVISDIISGVAVVISVLYLAYQVKKGNSIMLLERMDAAMNTQDSVNILAASNIGFCELMVKADENFSSLSDAERIQHMHMSWSYFNPLWEVYMSQQAGILPKTAWDAWTKGYKLCVQEDRGAKALWGRTRDARPPEFRELVDKLFLEIEK